MFCNKPQVNILTSLFLSHGIRDAIVCPGSRNAVIVHDFQQASINLYPVTDERSAAFVAIGLWLRLRTPIAICVTSGSALLNLLPGVSEAYYRHIPLIIVSADRPTQWIGQNDGQTLPQPDALKPYASSFQLPEIAGKSAKDEGEWYANRLVNEALCQCRQHGGQPVHINVPISEPLFSFTTPTLPQQRVIRSWEKSSDKHLPAEVVDAARQASHPWIVIGQYEDSPIPAVLQLKEMGWKVFAENISNHAEWSDMDDSSFSALIAEDTVKDLEVPDLVLYFGGAFVGKHMKQWLRRQQISVLRVDDDDAFPDTFCHLTYKISAPPRMVLPALVREMQNNDGKTANTTSYSVEASSPKYPLDALFLANSTAVRWAQIHLSSQRIAPLTFCNRGTNGIEGSISVAAGYSLVAAGHVFCLTGDLSFFYDANSLFNVRLDDRLRIMVVNNNGGGIFHRLPGLEQSPALEDYVAAHHTFSVKGIVEGYQCLYLTAQTPCLADDFERLFEQLLQAPSTRPVVMEVFDNGEQGAW